MDEKKDVLKQAIQYKKTIEKMPELAWQEKNTSDYIVSVLGDDYIWREKNGLIYKVGRGIPVFFRAELDALNTSKGARHVCGHSAHMSALMAVYHYLKKNPIPGFAIHFIFQPSEEGYPSGAEYISTHWKEMTNCKFGFAFHSFPSKKVGELYDVTMASGDYFEIEIMGKGTHIKNKNSDDIKDALIPASRLVQKINLRKFKNVIINVGTYSGGETPNSIAGQAKLSGDIRSLNEKDRTKACVWLKKIVNEEEKKSGASIKLYYNKVYPLLKNDKNLVQKMKTKLPIDNEVITFATEDFSLFPTNKIFLLIGTGESIDLHETDFRTSEKLLEKLLNYWFVIADNLSTII